MFTQLLLTALVKQEFHLEEDKYYTEDEYLEEEEEEEDDEEDSSVEKGSKKKGRGRATGEPRMKMRRIFRITHGRERQRGEGHDLCRIKYTKSLVVFSSHGVFPSLSQLKTQMEF